MKAVVTVVTFNNASTQLDLYARALRRAIEQARGVADASLLYLDNGGVSALDARVPGATALPPAGNVGYGPGLHRLLEEAFGAHAADLVVTSNPDGAFHADCLRILATQVAAEPRQLLEARQFPAEHPKPYDPRTGATPWASGCCMAISRAVFEAIGNVDPAFWLYLEDVDYSWRARGAGLPVRLVADALYAHEVTGRERRLFAERQMLLAGRVLGRKWQAAAGAAAFVRSCERRLAARDEPPDRLPALDRVLPVPAEWRAVADFGASFSFAAPRW